MAARQPGQLKRFAGIPGVALIYCTLLLVLHGSIHPITAQQNEPLPACTSTQRMELSTSIIENNLAFAELTRTVDTSTTAGHITAWAADYERFRTNYYAEIFPFVPPCSDAYLLRQLAGIAYDQTQVATLLLALLTYETDFGEANRAITYAEVLATRFEVARRSRELVTAMLNVTFTTNTNFVVGPFRACNADQLSWLADFDRIRAGYETLLDALNNYFINGENLPLDDILTITRLSEEITRMDAPLCEPLLTRGFEDTHLYLETSITLLLSELVELERTYGNEDTTNRLITLLEDNSSQLQARLLLDYPALFITGQNESGG